MQGLTRKRNKLLGVSDDPDTLHTPQSGANRISAITHASEQVMESPRSSYFYKKELNQNNFLENKDITHKNKATVIKWYDTLCMYGDTWDLLFLLLKNLSSE